MKQILSACRASFAHGTLLALLFLGGCHGESINPVGAILPKSKPATLIVDPAALQNDVLRLADEYISRTAYAVDSYATITDTDEARAHSMKWRVNVSVTAVGIASGPNPEANLLDFMTLTLVTRTALEEVWVKSDNGAAYQPWLDASRELEAKAWKLAEQMLTPEQRQEMREAIRKWWDANPDVHGNLFVRPEEVSAFLQKTTDIASRPGSVFALLGLDPVAGLDPAVREVTRSRLFAERAMFAAFRMTTLMRWEIELLANQLLREKQVTTAVGSIDRISFALESASRTAAELPDRISAERKAILDVLEPQEGKLRDLSTDLTKTMDAGEKMSTSLNTTIKTLDALMKRFGVGEPAPAPVPGAPATPSEPSHPFNILDYAHTADRMAAMAQQLDAVLKDTGGTLDSSGLDKRIADLNRLSDKARADAKSVLNHAFVLLAGLIVLILISAIIYRRVGRGSGDKTRRAVAVGTRSGL